jgi:hypothetical protein
MTGRITQSGRAGCQHRATHIRDGADVQAQLPVLSAYLGHSCPEATYWYFQATPELLALAAGRLQPPGEQPGTGRRLS